MKIKNKKNKRGFTLIELLIVIAIIGILASVILVSLSNAKQKAKDNAVISVIKSLATAIQVCIGTEGNVFGKINIPHAGENGYAWTYGFTPTPGQIICNGDTTSLWPPDITNQGWDGYRVGFFPDSNATNGKKGYYIIGAYKGTEKYFICHFGPSGAGALPIAGQDHGWFTAGSGEWLFNFGDYADSNGSYKCNRYGF